MNILTKRQVITGVFDGSSNYNGLVISDKVNLSSRLVMNSSYTWSHSIDDTSSFLGTTFDSATPASSYQPLSARRGNSAFDQRQRFINAFTRLPLGRGGSVLSSVNKLTDELIGGWTLSGITNLTTGKPFTILTNTNLDYCGFNQFLDRPNYICGGPLQINRDNPADLFNKACFTPAYADVIGSSPRNAYYGPELVDFDATLAKAFRITERVAFSFRADRFNVFNHTNFQMTSGNRIEANGTFGQISGTTGLTGGNNGGPRVIQLTGRVSF